MNRAQLSRKDSVGFSYSYNVAGIDPQPHARRVWERVKELKQDFKQCDYEKMLFYIAELELKNEFIKDYKIFNQ